MTHSTIPQFNTIEEESDFWDTHSVTDFEATEVTVEELTGETLPGQTKRRVTVALDADLYAGLQALAARRHIPTAAVVRELLRQGVNARREA